VDHTEDRKNLERVIEFRRLVRQEFEGWLHGRPKKHGGLHSR
jgi:hypothetical protein